MADNTEIEIPSYRDLMFPTLEALNELGGTGTKDEIDDKVVELVGITPAQLAVEYPEDAQQLGSKVVHRLAWARSYLRKLDAIDAESRGVWTLAHEGLHFIELGAAEVVHREHELRVGKRPESFLKRAEQAAKSDSPVEMTVRELLSEWEVSRRGASVVTRIKRDLKEAGLETQPPFETVPQGALVVLAALPVGPVEPDAGPPQAAVAPDSMTVTIGALDAVGRGVASIAPDHGILRAQSLMEAHDYSQLAVMEGDRNLKGAISWESIARAGLYRSDVKIVRDAMQSEPVEVFDDDSLLEHVRTIADAGYVFVRERKSNLVIGIVTAADLSVEFENLANPFLLLGEIEGWLRQIVDRHFSADDLAGYVDPDDPDRQIEAAESLTFGEYVRLLQSPDAWATIGLAADRQVFVEQLDEVRRIRNTIMHFSTDPLDDTDLNAIDKFLGWVRRLALMTPPRED